MMGKGFIAAEPNSTYKATKKLILQWLFLNGKNIGANAHKIIKFVNPSWRYGR
jgi:hypothetical protein